MMAITPEGVSFDQVMAAQTAIRPFVDVTPVVKWRGAWPEDAAPLTLKCENLQRTGSFKPRGAIWFAKNLSPDERKRGLVTVSAGNHALGVAYAAKVLSCPATVCMPVTASPFKTALVREMGAEVVQTVDTAAAFEEAMRLATEGDMIFVHPFDDPHTIAGQATLTLELLDQVPKMDLLVLGVGGAGLLAGAVTAIQAIQPTCRVVAVEPEGAATLTAALVAGTIVRLDHVETIADGLAPPFVGHLNYALVTNRLDDVVVVSDAAIRRAMKALFESAHLVVEPAGAAAMAALLEGGVDLTDVRHPVCVLSGGNVSAEDFVRHMGAMET